MQESKDHFLRVAQELRQSSDEVSHAIAESLRRQLALSLSAGFINEAELCEIEAAMPPGTLYFDGNIMHENAA